MALAGDSWVTDGNYRAVREIVWGKADTLLWLAYPFPLVLTRLVRRSLRRIRTQERVCGDNIERGTALWGRDSLVELACKTHFRRRKSFQEEFASPEYQHLTVHRFRSPYRTAQWVSRLPIGGERDKIG